MEQMGMDYGNEEFDSRHRPPPSKYIARPKVDAEASGEVDPNLYGQ